MKHRNKEKRIIMFREKTRLYKVYHIHEIGNNNLQEGYVGVTRRSLAYRLSQHFCSKRPVGTILRKLGHAHIEITLLAFLPKEDALTMEFNLRPHTHMAWNSRAGGNRRTAVCPICGKPLPKRKIGTICADCKPTQFQKGHKPANYGKTKYILIDPAGNKYTPESITLFCADHGLTASNIRKVAKGERKSHKGWTAQRIDG